METLKKIPGVLTTVRFFRAVRMSILKRIYGGRFQEVRFTKVWRRNLWYDPESRSGAGSNLKETAILRVELAALLKDINVRTLADIPCGDFNWMKEVSLPPGLQYLGGDIVEPLIQENIKRYGNASVSFRKINLLSDRLPSVDVVLCRDCLVHHSNADALAAIRNLKSSGSTYLLLTHYSGNRENRDVPLRIPGQWRPLNLTRPPFNFPPPLKSIDEHCTENEGNFQDKQLALWRLEDLPTSNQF